MKRFLIVLGITAAAAGVLWGSGGAEASSSKAHGAYLAGRGVIVPPDLIHESSYIGAVDYSYPEPQGTYGISAHAARRQVSLGGQELLVVVGVQGRHDEFSELPPLNLAFVIDRSGSMAQSDKMEWVKQSFDIFIESVRGQDYVSVVTFESGAQVIFPSTRVEGKRELLRRTVHSINTGGGTNLRAGLELGYQQVMANFRKEYVNRVLFLTDGRGESHGLEQMAASYRALGITLSTIGLGQDFDMELIRSLALQGGGSSRFISGREEMLDVFGRGLARTAVRVAEDLDVTVELAPGVQLVEAWGADTRASGRRVVCHYPGLHLGDYETTVLKLRIDPSEVGPFAIAGISSSYSGEGGARVQGVGTRLAVDAVDRQVPVDGISDAIVLRAGTMLDFAREIKVIGDRYYQIARTAGTVNQAVSKELVGRTNRLKKEIMNARDRLEEVGFDDEIQMLDNYLKILGGEAGLDERALTAIRADREIAPAAPQVPLMDRLEGLFAELALDLRGRGAGTVAVSGFARSDGKPSQIAQLLDGLAANSLSQGFTLVERQRIDAVLREQQLALSDLMETENAIKIGRFLTAGYILTGTVVPMQSSVVIFSRIIDTATAEVRSAAQVIVPIDAEMRSLL